ncbi:MAG: cupredoxin domain-containing protein [Pseudomonadota bacterium]
MKRLMITTAIALAFAAGGTFAHGDDKHGKQEEKADGHAEAVGKPGDPNKATRTIEVEMNDTMRFVPANIKVKRGETIKFVVKNVGKVKHEMVLGSMKELKEHAEMMRKFPEMEHADPNQVSVEPGKAGELVWQFTKTGTFDFACLQPGHFEAGMVGKVAVKR